MYWADQHHSDGFKKKNLRIKQVNSCFLCGFPYFQRSILPPSLTLQEVVFLSNSIFQLLIFLNVTVNMKYKCCVQKHQDNGAQGQRGLFTPSLQSCANSVERDLDGENGT